MERTKGVMFRSKAKWYEEGERSTKYFFSLEKARYNAKTCYTAINEDGQEIKESSDILDLQRSFYQKLYDVDKDVEFNLENTHGLVIPEDIRLDQDRQITIEEMQTAIKAMNNGKTPGQDGLPVEFYKTFWSKIKEVFYEMVLESYEQQYLHETARKGILNLLPKASKDTRYVKNLRPIILLNTDYKIIEKAVANKMIPGLEKIINKDQRGFMKERRISVNIRKMLDIIQQAEVEDIEAVVLSLDFVKCFDKCSFSILHGSLKYFQFGQVVQKWTKILYEDFTVKIQNNGYFSDSIKIKKGVHQGGCCSSVYFLVIAEILAIALRANEEIDGITIADIKNLLNQFADDMDVFTLCNEKSINNILEELNKFKRQSGFTVSYDKTTLYRIGSLRFSNAQLYGISEVVWTNEDINVLGVTIAHQDIVEKNYQCLVEKAKKVLNSWQNRGLSLIGKINVVNTLVASLFVYKMMVLPTIPKNIIRNIENVVREFIWNGKKAKVAYNILQNPKKEGGLNLVNISKREKALKATWPVILSKEDDYAKMVHKILRSTALEQDIWRCNLEPKDVDRLKIGNDFWKDVLKSWAEFNYYYNRRVDNQILWYNSEIKIKQKPFLWKDIQAKGLKYVCQLFNEKGYKTDEEVNQQFGLSKLRFNSIKTAMNKRLKEFFIRISPQEYQPLAPHNYDTAVNVYKDSLAKRVYQFLAEDVMIIHNKYIKWRHEMGENFCEGLVDYGTKYRDIYKLTNVPKFRSFQYRLLQRGLVTNIQLKKWNIVVSELCTFCGTQKETVVHLFCQCKYVKILWDKLAKYLKERFNLTLGVISDESIILNKIVPTQKNHVVNFICLLTKQFVYKQRCLGQDIEFNYLRNLISQTKNIEKYIAIKNNKLSLHVKKWERKITYDGGRDIRDLVEEYVNDM